MQSGTESKVSPVVTQSSRQTASQPDRQPASLSVTLYASEPDRNTVSQSVSMPFGRPARPSVTQSFSRPECQPATQSSRQSGIQSGMLSASHSVRNSVCLQSARQEVSRPVSQYGTRTSEMGGRNHRKRGTANAKGGAKDHSETNPQP